MGFEGLFEEMGETLGPKALNGFFLCKATHQNDGQFGILASDLERRLEAGQTRHYVVGYSRGSTTVVRGDWMTEVGCPFASTCFVGVVIVGKSAS
jgi:hypothetical protein